MSMIENAQNTIKGGIEKFADAMKSAQGRLEVPEAARDFVKRQADQAKDRAAEFHAGSTKATDAIESIVTKAVAGVAKFNRDAQVAAYEDVSAYFNAVGQIASAKSFEEAVQIQVDYLRDRGEANLARTRRVISFFTETVTEGAKKAQENVTAFVAAGRKAA